VAVSRDGGGIVRGVVGGDFDLLVHRNAEGDVLSGDLVVRDLNTFECGREACRIDADGVAAGSEVGESEGPGGVALEGAGEAVGAADGDLGLGNKRSGWVEDSAAQGAVGGLSGQDGSHADHEEDAECELRCKGFLCHSDSPLRKLELVTASIAGASLEEFIARGRAVILRNAVS
jgi:hypothetical protein